MQILSPAITRTIPESAATAICCYVVVFCLAGRLVGWLVDWLVFVFYFKKIGGGGGVFLLLLLLCFCVCVFCFCFLVGWW